MKVAVEIQDAVQPSAKQLTAFLMVAIEKELEFSEAPFGLDNFAFFLVEDNTVIGELIGVPVSIKSEE